MNRTEFLRSVLTKLQSKLMTDTVDAYLITKLKNIFYASGFGDYGVIFITKDRALLFTDFNSRLQALKDAPHFEVIQQKGDICPMIAEQAETNHVSRIGFDSASLTYDVFLKYKDALKQIEMVPVKDIVEDQRIIKNDLETGFMRKAAECADKAFNHVLGYIKPGVSENDIAAELEYAMRRNGASRTSFDSIVGSGENSAVPHAVVSERKICRGDAIVLDFGAVYNGYASDMTRTVFVGIGKVMDEELLKIYRIVLEAQKLALENAWSGRTGSEIDETARSVIRAAGYGENYGHGLGHGVGMEVHESPYLNTRSQEIMRDGMVVTIEPGIYIGGKGGVRIEDMIVINGKEPVVLSHSPKEMIIL